MFELFDRDRIHVANRLLRLEIQQPAHPPRVAAVPQPKHKSSARTKKSRAANTLGTAHSGLFPFPTLGTPDRLPPRLVPPRISRKLTSFQWGFPFPAFSRIRRVSAPSARPPRCWEYSSMFPQNPSVKSMIQKDLHERPTSFNNNH